jgi:hypothetical protein
MLDSIRLVDRIRTTGIAWPPIAVCVDGSVLFIDASAGAWARPGQSPAAGHRAMAGDG